MSLFQRLMRRWFNWEYVETRNALGSMSIRRVYSLENGTRYFKGMIGLGYRIVLNPDGSVEMHSLMCNGDPVSWRPISPGDARAVVRVNERWQRGLDHHPKSVALYEKIAKLDFANGDLFHFKSGGDGDNGETLMHLLDVIFEAEEAPTPCPEGYER